MGKIKKRGGWLLPAVCGLVLVVCLLAGYALYSQEQVLTRGLNLGAPLDRPVNLYGINVHLLGAADQNEQLATLKQEGFGWVRQEFDWQDTDWDQAQALADSTQANGLRLVATLSGPTPPDPVAFAAWAGEFARRFHDQIDYYQIWDEPNLASGWNGAPNPASYVQVLQSAYTAIHAADPTATVVLAGLAPTVETGPKNFSDVLYLRQLYDLGAQPYFDEVAGKPYGFNTGPDDRTVDINTLNFSRLILLREEMLAHNDGNKFVWGSNFGWNTRPSIWGQVTPDQQVNYAQTAYDFAAHQWQWAGPLFLETPKPNETPDDPHGGFAVSDVRLVTGSFSTSIKPGQISAQTLSAYAIFNGAWKFSELGADIPPTLPADLTFSFEGTDLAITVRRANYRAYLYVTIDGQPANALPQDAQGQAYLILTSPDLEPQTNLIHLAHDLPLGPHIATIHADRGWDQWALVSFTVGPMSVFQPHNQLAYSLLIILALVSLLGLILTFPSLSNAPHPTFLSRLGDLGQTILAALVALALWASAWLTWGSDTATAFRRYGDAAPLIVTVLTAGLLYYSPFLILTLLSLVVLFILFYLRPELALALIAFFAPFYLIPRPLFDRAFSMVEICVVLALVAIVLRELPAALIWLKTYLHQPEQRLTLRNAFHQTLTWLDLAVLAFVIVCGLSVVTAELRGVAFREFRVIVFEPVLFYLLLRVTLAHHPNPAKAIWLIVDFLVAGGVVVAVIGLGNYITGEHLITAEGGVSRITSVFGSPNNVGLFLGRILPIAAALVVLGQNKKRRIIYALAFIPMLAAAVLSLSRGALVFGIPAAFAVVLLFWGGKRAAVSLTGLAALGVAALGLLARNPRFANLFSTESGTGFFRVNVWRSAWAMFLDHPVLGVGLDNFLYAYRGHYIQPDAWQEPNLPHAHNIFLDALTRTGALGLLALLALLVSFLALTRQTLKYLDDPNLRALAVGLLASLADFAAHGLIDTGYWFVDLAFVFMLTLGLMAALSRLAASSNQKTVFSGQKKTAPDFPDD